MATELQKRALNIKAQRIKEKKPIVMGEIMIEAGYSKKAAEYPKRLIESKGWKEQLDFYLPDEKLLQTHAEALDSGDWRVKMQAVDMGYMIKDKKPAQKSKIIGLFEKISELEEE